MGVSFFLTPEAVLEVIVTGAGIGFSEQPAKLQMTRPIDVTNNEKPRGQDEPQIGKGNTRK